MGGLGIFMYGMRAMSGGLQELAGFRIRRIFQRLTHNRLLGVGVGLGITALIQSSSATTVMVVGFINAGLLDLSQAVGVIMGANIGTTITSWIIAIKVTHYALPILGIGVAVHLFAKKHRMRMWGQVLLGFGMLFFGLKLMETAFHPLRESPDFMPFFAQFGADTLGQILKSVLAGFLLTIIVQSSSTTIGITMALANQGLLTFPGAVAIVLGENLGTTITMELASIGTNVAAKRAARVHSLFNLIGVTYVILLFPWFIRLVDFVVPGPMDVVAADGTKPFIAAHIAAGHSIFNIFNTMLLLPCAGLLVRIASVMVPGDRRQRGQSLEFIDHNLIAVPSLAIELAKKELLKMGRGVKDMFTWSEGLLFDEAFDRDRSDRLIQFEKITDNTQTEISKFLAALLQSRPAPEVAEDARRFLRVADEFESIGDGCERIAKYAIRKEQQHIVFSSEAIQGLRSVYKELHEYMELCTVCFVEHRAPILQEVDAKSFALRERIEHLRDAHVDRLKRDECRVVPGLLYTDILTVLQNVRAHAHNAAEASLGLK